MRTTVAICDPSLLSAEDAMRFQVEATFARNAMTDLKFENSVEIAKANPVNTMSFDASIIGGKIDVCACARVRVRVRE